ncbi:MAG: globin [Halobacteriovorax sp.]|nr:globin [Halobacteriovorax sp.]
MSNSINENIVYGQLDASYRAAGEKDGIERLCRDFYQIMDTEPEAKSIRRMHKDDLEVMIDKLTLFLCLWLGGPKWYAQKYPFVGMPQAHQHLVINEAERDAWLLCMDKAVALQPFEKSFKEYLCAQFRFPANMIMRTSRSSEL